MWRKKLGLAVAGVGLFVAAPTPRSTVQAVETTPSLGCEVRDTDLAMTAVKQNLLTRLNAQRFQRGLPAFTISPSLTRSATWKATSVAGGGRREHDDDGRTWDQRFVDCGYLRGAGMGENMAQLLLEWPDQIEPSVDFEVTMLLNSWLNSPAHERLLSDPAFTAIGFGRVRIGRTIAWVTDFGTMLEQVVQQEDTISN